MAQYPEWMVYGGEVDDLQAEPPVSSAFVAKTGWLRDPDTFTLEGFYRTRKEAQDAWKAASWRTVDNALMRFFIVPCDWSYLPPVSPHTAFVRGTVNQKLGGLLGLAIERGDVVQ